MDGYIRFPIANRIVRSLVGKRIQFIYFPERYEIKNSPTEVIGTITEVKRLRFKIAEKTGTEHDDCGFYFYHVAGYRILEDIPGKTLDLDEKFLKARDEYRKLSNEIGNYYGGLVKKALENGDKTVAKEIAVMRCPDSVISVMLLDLIEHYEGNNK